MILEEKKKNEYTVRKHYVEAEHPLLEKNKKICACSRTLPPRQPVPKTQLVVQNHIAPEPPLASGPANQPASKRGAPAHPVKPELLTGLVMPVSKFVTKKKKKSVARPCDSKLIMKCTNDARFFT